MLAEGTDLNTSITISKPYVTYLYTKESNKTKTHRKHIPF